MTTITDTDIKRAQRLLEQDEVVAIPTETVYGLAANALSPQAVVKIFEAKNRPQFNPLIVHIAGWQQAERYARDIPPVAAMLAKQFCPGPLTFLLPKREIIPDLVTAGSAMVALRIPDHPLTLSLLSGLPFPLAAPSANPSGYISPTAARHVEDGLLGKIPYILDGGNSSVGLESTIIGFNGEEEIILYRAGGITAEQLEKASKKRILSPDPAAQHKPATSGQLLSHYAPAAALYIGSIEELQLQFPHKKIATINFCETYPLQPDITQYVLSPGKSLPEAASKLFDVMHLIDRSDAEIILTERFPDEGLGKAINDRLHRAQAAFK